MHVSSIKPTTPIEPTISKNLTKPLSIKPLKVLVTRPVHLAKPLAEKINQAGFITELLPVIEFKPTADQKTFRENLEHLPSATMAIFISATAVHYGMEGILNFWPRPPNILYAAIGPATLRALRSYAVQNIISPENPPFESETLLALPALQVAEVQGKNIFIFRGHGGRDLLIHTLKQRKAFVKTLECYQSQIPIIPTEDIAIRLNTWSLDPNQVTVTTSAQSLENLKALVGTKGWELLQRRPMIVVGLRMKALATTLGITQVIVAKGADDASLLEALIDLRDKIQG